MGKSDEIIKCLKDYEEASGQTINFQKSSIMFGDQVESGIQDLIKAKLGIFKEGGVGSYLGLPECFSGSKREILAYITEKLQQRLKGWYAKLLSQGGKEILLKSIAMALPVYAMSCFQMPKMLLKNITSAMMEFWWSTKAEKKPIYWISWESLCKPKSEGGLGFKDLAKFNQSLLAKQAWRLLDKPGCLLSQVYKSRYYPNKSFMSSTLGKSPSFAWRSILHGRELLSKGLLRVIGNGAETYVWTDAWLPTSKPRAPFNINGPMNVWLRVSDLMCQVSGHWKMDMLNQLFSREDIGFITGLQPNIMRTDRDVWHYTKSGFYTAKSGYQLLNEAPVYPGFQQLVNQPSTKSLMRDVWNIKTMPKIRTFIWKVLNGAVAVAERLRSRHIPINPVCRQCNLALDTINHTLFECIGARRVWQLAELSGSSSDFPSHSIYANIHCLLMLSRDPSVSDFKKLPWPWIMWSIWKGRNDFLFNGTVFVADQILVQARSAAFTWFQANNSGDSHGIDKITSGQFRSLRWSPPSTGFLMCNIASARHKSLSFMGVAWILRNEKGEVLYHGRSAPDSTSYVFQASLVSLSWALDCLKVFHSRRIIFAMDDKDVAEALNSPSDWPRQEYVLDNVLRYFPFFTEIQCRSISPQANRCAQAIATSVVKEGNIQSYIARSAPSWLESKLAQEAVSISS